jgi:deoxyribodipyrimidine photolyase-related protein
MEMKQEMEYTSHHIQKIVAFFLAMRNMSDVLKDEGHHVLYYTLDDSRNNGSLVENIKDIIKTYSIKSFEYQLPDEYRLDQQLIALCKEININTEVFDTEHFLTKREYLATFFEGKKTIIMESFYRSIRKNILF